jgi:hypothetical protein
VGAGTASSGRPRARRRFARGGVRPSSEAEISRPCARPSSEAEIRPRGVEAGRFDGLAEVIWVVGSSLHQAMIMRGVIYSLWVDLCFVVLREMGFSPAIRGPSWLSPTDLGRWFRDGRLRAVAGGGRRQIHQTPMVHGGRRARRRGSGMSSRPWF